MATNELSILLTLKDKATKELNAFRNKLDEAKKASAVVAGGLTVITTAAVAFGILSVKAASDAQVEMSNFNTLLKNSGGNFDDLKTKIIEQAKATEKLGFDDETAAVSIAKFYQNTGDLTKAFDLNSVSMDLARQKHIDLETASRMVNLVLAGNGKALKEFGISLKETKDPMEALKELQDKVKGSAENFAQTYQGQTENLKVKFNDLKETIGTKLLPVLTDFLEKNLIPIIEKLTYFANHLEEVNIYLKDNELAITIVAGAILGALIPTIYGMITAFAAGAIALAPFMLAGALIVGLIGGIISVVKNWEQSKDSLKFIWETIKEIWGKATNWVKEQIDNLIGFFSNLISKIKDALSWFDQFSLKNIGQSFADLPANLGIKFDSGGIVPGPIGTPIAALVHGGETILPTHKKSYGLGNIINLTITGNSFLDDRAAEKMGDLLIKKLKKNIKL